MARILILEDDEWIARMLAATLRRAGHIALESHSGREAEQLAESLKPELFIADIGMSGGEGLETIARIRRVSPGVTAIACTCEPLDAKRRRVAAACGAARVLDWNAGSAELLEAVDETLGLKASMIQPLDADSSPERGA